MAVAMTGQNLPGNIYDPGAGSVGESRMTGGAQFATWFSNFGGLAGVSDLVVVDADGRRQINGRVAVTTGLTVMAAAASGASAFSQLAGPGGAVAGSVLGLLSTAATGGFAAFDAQSTRAALLQIQEKAVAAKKMGEKGDIDAVLEALEFCLKQQRRKFYKGVGNATMAGQPIVALYRTGRAIQKTVNGTKGVGRADVSRQLVEISKKPSSTDAAPGLARQIIAAVVAKNYDSIMQDAVSSAMRTG